MEVKKNKWHPLLKNSPLISGKTQSQSQKIFYHPNGVANCLWAKQLNKNSKSIYSKAIPVIISRRESFDIDTKEDFEFIKSILMFNKYKRTIQKYIRTNDVAVIFPSKKILNYPYGKKINSFKNVIRFNDSNIKNYKKFVGSKLH